MKFLKFANLSLLILFPIAWFAPLLKAGFLPDDITIFGRTMPLFELSQISVISGLQSLWESDVALALLVTFFAIFAPMVKVLGLALIQFGLLDPRTHGVIHWLGRLAMADVFLIALYVVVIKGTGI
ncbi:MAG: paraquat-inducible protein A, partial [Rhodobacteraceae bacterium]|nr:paraquat-inducible protein A [Paracoccaceae bacterium]